MTAGFTSGPWDAGSRIIVVAGADLTPIDATECSVAFVPVARDADARLIAAAPELYEALDDLIELARPNVYPQPDKPDSPYGRLERARLILAKARGETPNDGSIPSGGSGL